MTISKLTQAIADNILLKQSIDQCLLSEGNVTHPILLINFGSGRVYDHLLEQAPNRPIYTLSKKYDDSGISSPRDEQRLAFDQGFNVNSELLEKFTLVVWNTQRHDFLSYKSLRNHLPNLKWLITLAPPPPQGFSVMQNSYVYTVKGRAA